RHIGFAEDDSTLNGKAGEGYRIGLGDVLRKARIAPGGWRPRPVETLLDGHGHAVEKALGRARFEAPVGSRRRLAGMVDVADDDRVQHRIVLLDPRPAEIEK